MSDMVSRYGKPVIVSAVGMDWQQASTAKAMISDRMTGIQALGSNGLGLFYREPEASSGWQGLHDGCAEPLGPVHLGA